MSIDDKIKSNYTASYRRHPHIRIWAALQCDPGGRDGHPRIWGVYPRTEHPVIVDGVPRALQRLYVRACEYACVCVGGGTGRDWEMCGYIGVTCQECHHSDGMGWHAASERSSNVTCSLFTNGTASMICPPALLEDMTLYSHSYRLLLISFITFSSSQSSP